jgi:hypothetical protein
MRCKDIKKERKKQKKYCANFVQMQCTKNAQRSKIVQMVDS